MKPHSFNEEDYEKIVEFLNFLAKKSILNNLSFEESIDFYKLLSRMQQGILPKIKAHILEVKKVHEAPPEEKELKPKKKTSKKK